MNWLKDLTPQHIQDLIPYASARREASQGQVWLNANENPYGRSPAQKEQALNRYPEFQPQPLLDAYARYAGVRSEQLLVTRGIDEGIDLLTRTFCQPGVDQVSFCPPTYGMYRIAAETHGVKALAYPLLPTWQLDLGAMSGSQSKSKLIYICSPNNPTGNTLQRHDIQALLEVTRMHSLVVVDEAYIEFKQENSVQPLLDRYPHLIIMRTLSKAFGLAGLRCGFLMAAPEIITTVQKVAAPYPIPVPVIEIAINALQEPGIVRMMRDVETITKDRQKTKERLKEYSFVRKVYPSHANFVLFQVDNARALMASLQSTGVVIRNQSTQTGLADTVRVTIGTELEMGLFYSVMQDFEEQQ